MSTSDISTLRQELLPKFRGALDFAATQAQRIMETYPGYLPMYTVGGKWGREGERWTHWCEGFFPGILWLMHQYTGDVKWRTAAEKYTRPLEPRKNDRNVHDLGFIFGSTYLRWYRLTGEAAQRDVLIQAGRTLALRRQKGGYLASFIGPQSLFIDIMMNVGMILWTANEAGDPALRDVALEHCRTTARTIVRADGSTAHEGIFDLDTGEFLRESTHQGWKPESAWSRGQAWALYGFTTMARLAGNTRITAHLAHGAKVLLQGLKSGIEIMHLGMSDKDASLLKDGLAVIEKQHAAIEKFIADLIQYPVKRELADCSELLSIARRCADYYLQRAPAGTVPLWDFDVPDDGQQPFDSSAAAIACSGLLDLAGAVDNVSDSERYYYAALKTLETLCSDQFLARSNPDWEGILMHGVYHKHKGLGVDESVAWGEHFFVEALVKAVTGRADVGW